MVGNALTTTSKPVVFGSQKWIDLLMKNCLPCKTNKPFLLEISTAPHFSFVETAEGFKHRIDMDTKGPIHPATKAYLSFAMHLPQLLDDAKTFFLNDAETAVDVLRKHWVTFFGPTKILVTDNGTECFTSNIANMCIFWH